jgi:hypothetical protein
LVAGISMFVMIVVSGIFSVSAIPLVTCQEYSQYLPSHWSHAKNTLSICHPIGHMPRILSVSTIPLVAGISMFVMIVVSGIFSVSGIRLVTRTVYSQYLPSHWSPA